MKVGKLTMLNNMSFKAAYTAVKLYDKKINKIPDNCFLWVKQGIKRERATYVVQCW